MKENNMWKVFLKKLISTEYNILLVYFIASLLYVHTLEVLPILILVITIFGMIDLLIQSYRKHNITTHYKPLKNLPDRLKMQAANVEQDGYISASELMREASYELNVRRTKLYED